MRPTDRRMAAITNQNPPSTNNCPPANIIKASMSRLSPFGARMPGSIQLEMRSRSGYRFFRAGLPGGNGHITHSAALTPYLAGGIGITRQPGPQIIHGKVDDLREGLAMHGGHQVQHRRLLHEPSQHATVQRRQHRVTDVVSLDRQMKDHFLTEAHHPYPEHAGVRNFRDQRHVVTGLMGIPHQLFYMLVHAVPPDAAGTFWLSIAPLPMRMKVPTTWASGSSRLC